LFQKQIILLNSEDNRNYILNIRVPNTLVTYLMKIANLPDDLPLVNTGICG